MKLTRFSIFVLLSSTVLLWSCTKELDTMDPNPELNNSEAFKKGEPKTKYLKGTIHYSALSTLPTCSCDPNTLQGPLFSGSGNISHLGLISTEVNSCVVPNVDFSEINVVSSCLTMVAANGDELFLEQEPYLLKLDVNTGLHQGLSVTNILGGTGRFKDVSGTIYGEVSQDLINEVVTSEMTGEIHW